MVLSLPGPMSRTQSISAGFFDGSTRVILAEILSADWYGLTSVALSWACVILVTLTCSSGMALPSIWAETNTQSPCIFFLSLSPLSSWPPAAHATAATTKRAVRVRITHLLHGSGVGRADILRGSFALLVPRHVACTPPAALLRWLFDLHPGVHTPRLAELTDPHRM